MNALSIANLKKHYAAPEGGRVLVVDVPHFEMADGEQVALRGESGSGKTTLLNLIAGILRADAGKIVVAGKDMEKLNEPGRDRLRALHVGYVFQTFNLLQGYTALENVLLAMSFGRGAKPAIAKKLLDRVGLLDRAGYKPRQLSVGQQQRVAVARALANHPTLLLADEPTGNLDRPNAQAALGLMREICREAGAALLLVSHDPFVLSQFERIQDLSAINHAATKESPVEILQVAAKSGHSK